jgi:hypothetical protein
MRSSPGGSSVTTPTGSSNGGAGGGFESVVGVVGNGAIGVRAPSTSSSSAMLLLRSGINGGDDGMGNEVQGEDDDGSSEGRERKNSGEIVFQCVPKSLL